MAAEEEEEEEEAVREAVGQRRFFPHPKTKRRPSGVAEEGKAAKSRATEPHQRR